MCGGRRQLLRAPPQSALCPIAKTLGVNCNREVPSLNLSETTFGNALALYALALHTSTQLALSCSPNSALLPVFRLFRLRVARFYSLVRRRKSRGTEFVQEETTGRFQGLLEGFFVTLVPSGAPTLHHGGCQKFCLAWCEESASPGRKRLTNSVFGTSGAQDKTNQICPNGSLRETWPWSLADFWGVDVTHRHALTDALEREERSCVNRDMEALRESFLNLTFQMSLYKRATLDEEDLVDSTADDIYPSSPMQVSKRDLRA